MHLEVTFKNLRPREEVRRRAQALMAKMERFVDPAASGLLTVSVEHDQAVLEVSVTTAGHTYVAREEDPELRTALDRVMHNLENQLRRGKERREDRRAGKRERTRDEDGFVAPEPDDVDEVVG